MEERLSIDMQAACSKIKISEVLTIHGTEDSRIPFEDAKYYAQYIRPHVLAPIEGADHNFSEAAPAQLMVQKLISFLTSGL